MHRPGTMLQHVGLFMLMHVLVCKSCWGVLRKEKEGREREMPERAGFIKQTVDSLCVCVCVF